jgi:enoyl-CoA hydratase
MDWQTIRTEEEREGIRVLTLSRPEVKNALSIRMRREISEALARFREDPKVRCVVVTGAGDVFCAGFDLKEFGQADLARDVFESSARYHRDLWGFPKPTIAAVNGAALAGGLDLACLCDIRIASSAANFGHPEIKFGAPPLFTPLRWLVGHGFARDLCLTGRRISADEALRVGLVSEIASPETLLDCTLASAAAILEAPDEALAYTKGYVIENEGKSFEESFVAEHDKPFRRFLLRE